MLVSTGKPAHAFGFTPEGMGPEDHRLTCLVMAKQPLLVLNESARHLAARGCHDRHSLGPAITPQERVGFVQVWFFPPRAWGQALPLYTRSTAHQERHGSCTNKVCLATKLCRGSAPRIKSIQARLRSTQSNSLTLFDLCGSNRKPPYWLRSASSDSRDPVRPSFNPSHLIRFVPTAQQHGANRIKPCRDFAQVLFFSPGGQGRP